MDDLRKCSPLSNSFSYNQLQNEKKEIEDRNLVYREKFPHVRKQMEENLAAFVKELGLIFFYLFKYIKHFFGEILKMFSKFIIKN